MEFVVLGDVAHVPLRVRGRAARVRGDNLRGINYQIAQEHENLVRIRFRDAVQVMPRDGWQRRS